MKTNYYKQALNKAFSYLSYKSRTEKEVISYLSKNDFDDTVISEVIIKLRDLNYVNDNTYAIDYVNNSIEKQTKGINLIRKELLEKGINEKIVSEHLALYSSNLEIRTIENVTKKFFSSKKSLPLNQIKAKLYSRLLQRGFTIDTINYALKFLDEDREIQSILLQQEEFYNQQAKLIATKFFEKYSKNEKNEYKVKQKLYGKLISKGFDYSLCNVIVEEILNNNK
ncbi:regulatory protein [Natronincola peptidivorans]|uniref:Regulatory protein RecX n=1 Tax=Natronincola peptidivorans TaxID=426128 RepID=A0A1H9YNE4_9FIRM|nr:RecX family transcriptional regulator [Natronincola peptidivorans]SES70573.1 regulatory protein [Natronincola peptidivorans]